ncbi:MAG: cysteine--1-D-myo-inosityl 2-amino-2-deoxy-alpha-D-glucopyranoside ligase, partial [Cryobacterium sp.]|nr:cysteine--1-D-myo-inosityl 2-amino-2-deoxy-alpha-D-glucopyranoside ligase [Cryobacterium sp.]
MRSWAPPQLPTPGGGGALPRIFDTSSNGLRTVELTEGVAQLYVCGITPYDATHLGHAATYLAYDTVNRVLRDAGHKVHYVQNVTDVDDPLLERATATGTDWRDLAASQIDLFRSDMEALRIIPPEDYVGVVESIDRIGAACARLLDDGFAYWVDSPDAAPDLYFDIAAGERMTSWHLGQESRYSRETMLTLSAERGGDPDRAGKRDRLDPLLWRSERAGEPAWDSAVGRGRPGWHIECSVIGGDRLAAPITLNGGGSDLVFPHHEMSAAHSAALTGLDWSRLYSHAGMVSLDGAKMSKSRGNLVFVSRLTSEGFDPRAIRLAVLAHHYREDWAWSDAELALAERRLASWTEWARRSTAHDSSLSAELRHLLLDDLNTPAALNAVDVAVD